MPTHLPPRLISITLWCALSAQIGCDAGGGGGSSPTGTRILAGRDFGNLFFWNEATLGFTRQAADNANADPNANRDLWIWPNDASAPLVALPQIDWSRPYPYRWYALFIGDLLMTGSHGERLYDLAARAEISFKTAADGPSEGSPSAVNYAAIRRDGGMFLAHRGDIFTLLAGRGSGLLTAISSLLVKGVDFMGADLVVLGRPVSDPLAPDRVYRIALPSGEVSPLPVPPFDAAPSAADPLDIACTGFNTHPCQQFRVVGCGEGDPPCPETGRPPCFILYTRGDASARQVYAFDVATGQEQALPGAQPFSFSVSPTEHRVAWTPADNSLPTGADTTLYFHDFCTGADGQCPTTTPQTYAWRHDGDLLTMWLNNFKVGMVSFPEGRCGRLGEGTPAEDIVTYQFSPDHDHLAWLSFNGIDHAPDHKFAWIGDGQGNGTRFLASGAIAAFGFSRDGQRMFLMHSVGEQFSLDWVSVSDDQPAQHRVADLYDGSLSSGNRRVLLIDRWNSQDASGTLTLIDLASGERQIIAQAVTDFTANASVDGEARLVYSVHGRFPSERDGLWQTTLPP